MVRHGRREDRAAAYDQFTAVCARFYLSDDLTPEAAAELMAALQAVNSRAPKQVREAADRLFRHIVERAQYTATALAAAERARRRAKQRGGASGPAFSACTTRAEKRALGLWTAKTLTATGSVLDGESAGIDFADGTDSGAMFFTPAARLRMELDAFAEVTRLDLTARWWHVMLTPWGRRWWLARK
ncbi:hypothetical protein ABT213_06115 [Streptomyces sp. NPDC001674]|uniref:hypothetical protein n=1 Tax=Streptomyces sp. NPDC001674 TaxID=3154394 RepID=UPI00331EF311